MAKSLAMVHLFQAGDGEEVVVGVRAEAAANAWGAWDDLTLYTMD